MTTGQLLKLLFRDLFDTSEFGAAGPRTRTFRMHVIANNLDWSTLEKKLEDVRKFYEPVLDLQISVSHVSMQLQYNSSYPALAPLAVVEYEFYDRNFSIPHLADADIVMLLSPRPASPMTFGGIMTFANCGPWETTVFTEPENYHAYVQGKDLGNVNTLLMQHELSHAFYRMQSLREDLDNTHKYFYGGTPELVLQDLHFSGVMSRNEMLSELGRKLAGALVALGIINKYRTAQADPALVGHPEVFVEVKPPVTVPAGRKLYDIAKARMGTDVSPADLAKDELGCAESVSNLIRAAYGDFPIVLGTAELKKQLVAHPKFRQLQGEVPDAGDIVLCVTGEGSSPSDHGHTGIIALHGILSNDSRTGKFNENYTLASWSDSFRPRGFRIYLFRRVSL